MFDIAPFLVEGCDGASPVQAYCSVKTSEFMIVDSIYPHADLSILVHNNDERNPFGDNDYTRKRAIAELKNLHRIIHGVMHFCHEYKDVLERFAEVSDAEYAKLDKMKFATDKDRGEYVRDMHKRLKEIYRHYLEDTIPEIPFKKAPEMVIQPYLLEQILKKIFEK